MIFSIFSFLDPSHIYCIGLRENYYGRFKVPAVRRCAEKIKIKNHCVPEAPSAEQVG